MLLKSIASDKKFIIGTAEVTQLLRECTTFTEDQSLGPNIHAKQFKLPVKTRPGHLTTYSAIYIHINILSQ